VLAIGAATALLSLAIGLLAGASLSRSLSLGLYAVGALATILGFALGMRGPLRAGHRDAPGLRWLGPHEREDAISDAALFVAVGFALLVLGVLADTRYPIL
jgi:hypothetical protein